MTEQITDLERCWFLSPPWGQEIPPVEINLSEKVYFKTDRTFGLLLWSAVVWRLLELHY
ncbi:hypothetical protein DSM107007_53840 [Nostoc sp. PCC 7120 = FACHB-418]|uniref:DUF1392 family protein n=1 Tax=Nostoc sp. (strain PCC 7120 / SAG 25.82 / UTEX 2576) TaxID=103690 RepID=UPI000FAD8B50|nr:hypothetical protein DSM107007_53840 [Nostoc sp. PCC 7120 = FACHB-418]